MSRVAYKRSLAPMKNGHAKRSAWCTNFFSAMVHHSRPVLSPDLALETAPAGAPTRQNQRAIWWVAPPPFFLVYANALLCWRCMLFAAGGMSFPGDADGITHISHQASRAGPSMHIRCESDMDLCIPYYEAFVTGTAGFVLVSRSLTSVCKTRLTGVATPSASPRRTT